MPRLLLPICLFLAASAPSYAIEPSIARQLNKLAPQDRIEQRCDIEAMEQITKGAGKFNADRVVSYTFGSPNIEENQIDAHGAAFRSKGNWYRLSYKCSVDLETLSVKSFEFDVGEKIPEEDWSRYYLYG